MEIQTMIKAASEISRKYKPLKKMLKQLASHMKKIKINSSAFHIPV